MSPKQCLDAIAPSRAHAHDRAPAALAVAPERSGVSSPDPSAQQQDAPLRLPAPLHCLAGFQQSVSPVLPVVVSVQQMVAGMRFGP